MTDQDIRHAIKVIIAGLYPTAKVYEWNALSHDLSSWPGMFRTATGTHGWIIKRGPIDSEWKHGGRERPVYTYDIWGFYEFRTGKEGDNSDGEWSVIIDAIREGLKEEPRLGLEEDEVERHELLQVLANTTIDCGEETLHFANCKLRVKICC